MSTTKYVCLWLFFFFNDTATTDIYTVMNTLSLHDALPIFRAGRCRVRRAGRDRRVGRRGRSEEHTSELQSLITISYAVFCLKKKKFVIIKTYYKKFKKAYYIRI